MRNNNPIGFMDSGIGGITVLKASREILPHESFLYIGDTANVPYGDRSPADIQTLGIALARRLLAKRVKCLAIACNTISAVALPDIQAIAHPIPVIDVIKPTIESIPNTNGAIAIIGTTATIQSHIYRRMIQGITTNRRIIKYATPALVPAIEQTPNDKKRIQEAIAKSLCSLLKHEAKIDTLVLGCTHYAFIRNSIEDYIGKKTTIVDSSLPTAMTLKRALEEHNLVGNGEGSLEIIFTKPLPLETKTYIDTYLGSP